MKLKQVSEILQAKVLTGRPWEDIEVHSACGCDLMSDVLAFVKDQALLLTGLVNPQVIRTAEMMDIKTIVFVRGKVPQGSVLELAEEMGMTIMTTALPLYVACGELYQNGLKSKEV
ncbi:MAG: hypothetical protein E7402_02770 [Ruminococcaceae bacterium]|nr:hypothetical protein [Oscillospiraceae bacterium]